MSTHLIGIAGYSGCGKSTAAVYLQKRCNALLINADAEAKRFMASDPDIINQLCQIFGTDIYHHGLIDFSRLGERAFASIEMVDKLNSVVHPPFLIYLRKQLDTVKADTVIVDAALIKLWHIEHWFSDLWWIDALRETRIQRILSTGISDFQARQRVVLQEQLFAAPVVAPWTIISNNGSPADLYAAIDTFIF